MKAEVFLPVPGFPGYSVGDHGTVISHSRAVTHYRGGPSIRRERIMKTSSGTHGYPQVALSKDAKCTYFKVANLVMLVHGGPKPPGVLVCHNDGDRANSAFTNLRYDTYKGNSADMVAHGTRRHGENAPNAKLTDLQAAAVRSDARPGSIIAKEYGVTRSLINAIRRGEVWKHLGAAS